MERYYEEIGKILCGLGGGLLVLIVLGLLCYFVCCAWVAFSNRFRGICKAESLIFEYRKNRHDFMIWKHLNGGDAQPPQDIRGGQDNA